MSSGEGMIDMTRRDGWGAGRWRPYMPSSIVKSKAGGWIWDPLEGSSLQGDSQLPYELTLRSGV